MQYTLTLLWNIFYFNDKIAQHNSHSSFMQFIVNFLIIFKSDVHCGTSVFHVNSHFRIPHIDVVI